MRKTHVFIDGDQGTTGLQIRERLANRTDLALVSLPDSLRKDAQARGQALNDCDIAILCLPDDAAREAVSLIQRPGVRVIDASSAHRTHEQWVYGLPELGATQAQRIASATRVSNPGCYPTGAIALLRPLVAAGLVPADYPFVIQAVSGYSGGGRAAVQRHEADADALAFEVYGLGLQHKHVPEIQRHAGLAQRPVFVPSYGSFRQGIVLTIALQGRLLPEAVTADVLHAELVRQYADCRHVSVLTREQTRAMNSLDPQALNGTDDVQLGVFDNGELGHILLTAVFDNLGKGAAGAAVQNLDLMMGVTR